MKFYKELYIGDTVKDINKIKRKLKFHAGTFVYVICLCQGEDQLEIFHSSYLKQKYYRFHPPIIIGIASDEKEAIALVVKITEECVEHTGGGNLKEYLKIKVKNKSKK